MIIDTLVTGVFGFLGQVAGALPTGSLNLGDTSGFALGFATFNQGLPLSEAVSVMAILIGTWSAVMGWRLLRMAYGLLPFVQ